MLVTAVLFPQPRSRLEAIVSARMTQRDFIIAFGFSSEGGALATNQSDTYRRLLVKNSPKWKGNERLKWIRSENVLRDSLYTVDPSA
jgi:hypothetical protein